MELFWAKGYEAAGLAELTREMGINPPSLYTAFGSKLGLFRAAIDRYCGTRGSFFTRLSGPEALDVKLRAVLELAIEVYTSDDTAKGCLIMDGARNCGDEGAIEAAAAIREGLREQVHTLASEAQAEPAAAIADYFVFLLTGLSAAARDGASRDRLKRDLETAWIGLARILESDA